MVGVRGCVALWGGGNRHRGVVGGGRFRCWWVLSAGRVLVADAGGGGVRSERVLVAGPGCQQTFLDDVDVVESSAVLLLADRVVVFPA